MSKKDRESYSSIEDYAEYEYTNNMIYQFYKRTKDFEKKKFEIYRPEPEKFSKITLDDIILYKNENRKKTLQDVIYNIYPSIYYEFKDDEKFNKNEILLEDFEEYIRDEKYIFNEIIYKDEQTQKYINFTKEKMSELIEKKKISIEVTPKYSSPSLIITQKQFIDINNLNINLPDKELLAFIKQLKVNSKCININLNNTNVKKKFINVIYNSFKLADILFLYDNNGCNLRELMEEIIKYRILTFNNILDIDLLKEDYPMYIENIKKVEILKNEINNIFEINRIIDGIYDSYYKKDFTKLITKITKIVKNINNLLSKIEGISIDFPLIISPPTIYNYKNISKYYIDGGNYITLCDVKLVN